MKFLMTFVGDSKTPPSPEKLAELAEFTAEMVASGVVLMHGGLVRPTTGTRVRRSGESFTVTDGPFAETKEVIDGFALVEAGSKEEAIAMARRFTSVAGDGEGEILQVFAAGEFPGSIPH
jgi:hypothetical protein